MNMSTMIQIRNVPDAVHRRLKAQAALEGLSLSEYLLREVRLSLYPALGRSQPRFLDQRAESLTTWKG